MGPCVNRPLAPPAPPPRQAKPHACLFDFFDRGVAAFPQRRLNERSTGQCIPWSILRWDSIRNSETDAVERVYWVDEH